MTTHRQPTQTDWRNLFRSIQYDLRTGWHYQIVLCIAAVFSIMAIYGTFKAFTNHPSFWLGVLSPFSASIVVVFWLALRRGLEHPWEPTVLTRIGFLGLITFGKELRQLFRTRLVGTEIECLFQSMQDKSPFAGAFAAFVAATAAAFAGAGAFAAFAAALGAGTGFFVTALAFSVAVKGGGTCAGAGAFTGAFAVTFAFAGWLTIPRGGVRPDAGFAVVGGIVAVVVAVAAGIGLRIWYSRKSNSKNQWLRFFTVLAFPWFCWLPITLVFATVGFYALLNQYTALLSQYTPLRLSWLSVWQQTVLIEVILVGVGSVLWRRGHYLDRMARNPLQGGIVEQALREACKSQPIR